MTPVPNVSLSSEDNVSAGLDESVEAVEEGDCEREERMSLTRLLTVVGHCGGGVRVRCHCE